MYIKVNRKKGESDEKFECRKQKIKSFLDNVGSDYEEFTGAIDVISSKEAKYRLDYLLKNKNLKFMNNESYNKALDALKYELGDSDILDNDYINRMCHWILGRDEHATKLVKIEKGVVR